MVLVFDFPVSTFVGLLLCYSTAMSAGFFFICCECFRGRWLWRRILRIYCEMRMNRWTDRTVDSFSKGHQVVYRGFRSGLRNMIILTLPLCCSTCVAEIKHCALNDVLTSLFLRLFKMTLLTPERLSSYQHWLTVKKNRKLSFPNTTDFSKPL